MNKRENRKQPTLIELGSITKKTKGAAGIVSELGQPLKRF